MIKKIKNILIIAMLCVVPTMSARKLTPAGQEMMRSTAHALGHNPGGADALRPDAFIRRVEITDGTVLINAFKNLFRSAEQVGTLINVYQANLDTMRDAEGTAHTRMTFASNRSELFTNPQATLTDLERVQWRASSNCWLLEDLAAVLDCLFSNRVIVLGFLTIFNETFKGFSFQNNDPISLILKHMQQNRLVPLEYLNKIANNLNEKIIAMLGGKKQFLPMVSRSVFLLCIMYVFKKVLDALSAHYCQNPAAVDWCAANPGGWMSYLPLLVMVYGFANPFVRRLI